MSGATPVDPSREPRASAGDGPGPDAAGSGSAGNEPRITVVSVPVADQDRSLAFYRDVLGFALLTDERSDPSMRWVQLQPPGGTTSITLTTWFAPRFGPGALTGIVLEVDDFDAAVAGLSARGLSFTAEPTEAPWGRWTTFDDPDGNSWVLQQSSQPRTMAALPGEHPGGLVVLSGGSRDGESTVVAEGVSVLYAASDGPGLLDVYTDTGTRTRLRGNDEPATVFSYSHQVSTEGIAPEAVHMPSGR